MTNGSKNGQKVFLIDFDHVGAVCIIKMGLNFL